MNSYSAPGRPTTPSIDRWAEPPSPPACPSRCSVSPGTNGGSFTAHRSSFTPESDAPATCNTDGTDIQKGCYTPPYVGTRSVDKKTEFVYGLSAQAPMEDHPQPTVPHSHPKATLLRPVTQAGQKKTKKTFLIHTRERRVRVNPNPKNFLIHATLLLLLQIEMMRVIIIIIIQNQRRRVADHPGEGSARKNTESVYGLACFVTTRLKTACFPQTL